MKLVKKIQLSCLLFFISSYVGFADTTFNAHKVVLDKQGKILPWYTPAANAYDHFLDLRWNFIKTRVPNCPGPLPMSSYPQYYFYCAYWDRNGKIEPDTWMNDVGEKIPNWFESARLYYAYTGDTTVMTMVKNLIDYAIEHGTSPSTFSWPNFPYTASNAGDIEFIGFTRNGRVRPHEVQVDHAGDVGLTYYRLYLYTGDEKYKTAALNIANTLVSKVQEGSATQSPWPQRVHTDSGDVLSPYGANWFGCYALFDNLIEAKLGNVVAYKSVLVKIRDFILQYPMQSGYWTDTHTDCEISSNTYKSNMSASNAKLYMMDHPEFNPNWKTDVPKLIKWTEDYFVFRTAPGEPSTMWGANIVGEQDTFLVKMDYQTARYAAECARWYAISGDETYKEKAYRSLNWVTYCNDSFGKAFESPVSKGISNWWSDCYGECTRMFYNAFAAIPEWAPPRENHILYSEGILKNVSYAAEKIQYTPTSITGIEYLRTTFKPKAVTVNGVKISLQSDLSKEGYTLKDLENGDYAVNIKRMQVGDVIVSK